MNYTNLLKELNQASLFDLYRLDVAIKKELESPKKILEMRKNLRIDMVISYFDSKENRLKKSTLIELKQKNVVVLDHQEQRNYIMPYYMLNLEKADTEIYENPTTEKLGVNNLKVGDCVSFHKDADKIVGIIRRLNHKTVTLVTAANRQWRVSYSLLYRVYEAGVERELLENSEV